MVEPLRPFHSFKLFFSSILLVGALPAGLIAQTDTTASEQPDSLVIQPSSGFIISDSELDAELGSQDISGLLQSSRDLFASTAGFNFGIARFRIRGLDNDHNTVAINGVMVNDLESGWASWSQWGGLNDITRYQTVRTGLQPSLTIFGGIGGYTNIDARASQLRKGTRISYSSTNRTYRNRIMLTHSTGMRADGWAFTISGSRRWAEEGYVEGTFYDAYAYFLSAEKKLNDRHSISLVGLGAPNRRGRQGLAVQEAYDLAGSNYYNPYWGLQNGEVRNSRESFDHEPMLIFSHTYTPDPNVHWTNSLAYSFGRSGRTALNWYDAKDPRPDYYRYLPSYYADTDPYQFDLLTSAWKNDVNTRQINWDQLYFANGKNLYTLENANGIEGNDLTGLRSKYIVEEWRDDQRRLALNSVYDKRLNDQRKIKIGGSIVSQESHIFKEMNDLLGGEFWVDVDQFAEQDFSDPSAAQNDLNNVDNVIREGDVFGYDYDLIISLYDLFAQYEVENDKWQMYGTFGLGYTSFFRDGNMRNGRFPDNSEGKSEVQDFFTYGLKGGLTRKISGRQFVTANAALITRAPSARDAYVSPRTRDQVVPGLKAETVYSGDIGYHIRFPRVKGRATLFFAQVNDQVWNRSFYHDELRTFVNYSMANIDQQHMGMELAVQATITPTLEANAVIGTGQYIYDSRPTARITRDNSNEVLAEDRLVFLKNYRIGGMPQTASSLGLRYNSPQFWFIGVNANFFNDIYLDPNPDRRTQEALSNIVVEDPQWSQLLDQTELDSKSTVDVYAGKSWRVKKYFIRVNLSVNNLLDEDEFVVGGFEQLRYDRTDIDRFPPKYSYLFGRNYYAMVTFSF